ncbi:alternate-type signal peptide domain-containing protein [Nocardioides sp.]|uniref:alternate-type signal peptide domain-containing protein n=1 Tax=Nocardioides sp. TaxID=35761 RepID=UPI002608E448|nr:alternate-type signal peptide domain-containing protein [Nocardioides sp.]
MRNSIKAALAATTGAALLLGGAGSLAYWQDVETETGDTVTTGVLDVTAPDCEDGWVDETADLVDFSNYLVVPGEVFTQQCTFTFAATGDNLSADIGLVAPSALTGTLAGELTYTATYTWDGGAPVALDDAAVATITNVNNGDTLVIDMEIELPFGVAVDNGSNNGAEFGAGTLQAVVEDVVVTVTQTDPNP